jgi:hypothetical protein
MKKFVWTISSIHGGTISFSGHHGDADGWCTEIPQEKIELLMKHFRVNSVEGLSGKIYETTTKTRMKSLNEFYSRILKIWSSHIGYPRLWMIEKVSCNKYGPKRYELDLECIQPGSMWERVRVKEPAMKLLLQYFEKVKPEDLVGKTFEKVGINPASAFYALLLDLSGLNLI